MTTESSEVHAILSSLRDVPVTTEGMSEETLVKLYRFLMAVPSGSDNVLHWFCARASLDTIEAATFLIRMFAYEKIDEWRDKFHACLGSCADCVQSLERVKVSSRTTYFGAYTDDTLNLFYQSFEKAELQTVLQDLTRAGFPAPLATVTSKTLFDVPPAVVYRMLSNFTIFKDPHVYKSLHVVPSASHIFEWPRDPLPPGLLILLLDDDPHVRRWAESYATKTTTIPISHERFSGTYLRVLETIGRHLTDPRLNQDLPFLFAKNPADFWSGFRMVLRQIPVEVLGSRSSSNFDFRGIITRHLYDTGSHFEAVLQCFLLILKRMGEKFWVGEEPEFPQVVFDSVKENRSFLDLFTIVNTSKDRPWFLAWFAEYLHTIRELPIYSEVLARVIDFLCEETQHERFQIARPFTMAAGLRLLNSILRKSQAGDVLVHGKAVSKIFDIHREAFLGLAFSRIYDAKEWQEARDSARTLISSFLDIDCENIALTATRLSRLLFLMEHNADIAKGHIKFLSTKRPTYQKLYDTIQSNDLDGIALMLSSVSRTSHIDLLIPQHFSKTFSVSPPDGYQKPEEALNEVNHSLAALRDGLLGAVTRFADYNVSSTALDFLKRPSVVRNIIKILMSPNEELEDAAQVLVGVAFDVDGRHECLRALLENIPTETLEGILEYLNIFIDYAPIMPEACNLSKSLVRCFTDIIDVLCGSPNGLLHSHQFLKPEDDNGPASNLLKLWNLMTKSLTVILKRTPAWAPYFENELMIVWMRDALIFGRDLLATWRVIETAANTRLPDGSRHRGKLSSTGKKMVDGLQDILLQLAGWLRLTDEELLHQAFSLLTSLLAFFKDANVAPRDDSMSRLRKSIENARVNVKDPSRKSRLDSTMLLTLEAALDDFEDVVEIVEVSNEPSKARAISIKQKELARPKVQTTLPVKEQPKQKPDLGSSSTTVAFQQSRHFIEDKGKPASPGLLAIRKPTIPNLPTIRKPTVATATAARPPVVPVSSIKTGPKFEGNQAAQHDLSSSDESSSEDEGETKGGLASLAKLQKSPKIRKPAQRRQIMTMDIPMQKDPMVEARRIRREEIRNATYRLNPDVSGLHRAVLSWEYHHIGPHPPGDKLELLHVPDTFTDYPDYKKVWEPLLLLDLWAQIGQTKEEIQETLRCKVIARQFVDQWLDLDVSFPGSIKKDWYLIETDLVLLKHSGSNKTILAKAMSFKATPHDPLQGAQASLRCFAKNDPGLQIGVQMDLSKVLNLTTVQREYAALVSLPYYNFFQTIMQPTLSVFPKVDPKDIRDMMSTYRVNEPQAKAILSALHSQGFVLVQGPPGTGKTSTICSLVASSLVKSQGVMSSSTASSQKILLCAPSNAAIDEIAARLHTGSFGPKKSGSIKVVRIGAKNSIGASVQDIFLDNLVEARVEKDRGTSGNSTDVSQEILRLKQEIDSLKQSRMEKEQQKENFPDNSPRKMALSDEISQLRARHTAAVRELNQKRDQNQSRIRDLDARRRACRLAILQEAHVICATLSGAALDTLGNYDFEMVIVDEAAQAVELSSLIPLRYKATRIVMVGDPQQLPPTVISQEACRFRYNESLFVRLQKQNPDLIHLLSIQYRMHPDISCLPSRVFYHGRLQDGPAMAEKTTQPWHTHPKFGTYQFFDVYKGLEESAGRSSIKNVGECQVAVALFARLTRDFRNTDFRYRVGIVSMYRAQLVELRRQFQQRFGLEITDTVDFNTVDGFQGQEKDVIILSCVRSGPSLQSVGFLSDYRRMNVALTRAKSSLFILGNAATLERCDKTWKAIIENARSRSSLISTETAYFTTPGAAPIPVPPEKIIAPAKPLRTAPSMPTSIPTIPDDLVAPRDFKVLSHFVEKPRPLLQKDARPPEHLNDEKQGGPSRPQTLKRPADDEGSSAKSKASMKPPMPPAKRPKQTSIFIPKSNKKR